jgi:hypothetical protein
MREVTHGNKSYDFVSEIKGKARFIHPWDISTVTLKPRG